MAELLGTVFRCSDCPWHVAQSYGILGNKEEEWSKIDEMSGDIYKYKIINITSYGDAHRRWFRQQTRNQNANLDTAALQPEPIINAGVTDDKESRINKLVSAAASAQQTQLFSEFKQQMTILIQSSLETTFRDFGAPDPSLSMPSFETRPNIPQLPPVRRNEETRPLIHPSKAVEKILSLPSEGTTPQSPGKNVLQILFMWLPRYHILPLALSRVQWEAGEKCFQ
ncbi:hypothetical protein GQX74_009439 [Glossina fuscipes]|nr:hypothetical protein GQX74_009439 [Glossina fuscipes]